jgi:hypothetical protein
LGSPEILLQAFEQLTSRLGGHQRAMGADVLAMDGSIADFHYVVDRSRQVLRKHPFRR